MCLFYLYANTKIEIHICSNKHETGLVLKSPCKSKQRGISIEKLVLKVQMQDGMANSRELDQAAPLKSLNLISI